ncbi:adenosylcobinamide-GDP ribazoletransferase [Clostridium paraputrificum]|uniref:adenosylcobinamide-GDP ribazoletransferase n=1 Tax=Clostridium paraputrificum TaxID=29363 RepID=UPI003D332555
MKDLGNALNMAISMFTVIPLPKYIWEERSAKHIMKIYPLIGLVIGGLWYGAYYLLKLIGCQAILSSAILLAVPYLLTGFLHLDGFMDVSDALLSRRPKEEKIRILKDSTVGAFAVISLALVLIIEFAAIYTVLVNGKNPLYFIIIPIVSRSMVGYFMITKDSIGESYFGKLFKDGTGIVDKVILIGIYLIMILLSYRISVNHLIMVILMGIVGFLLVNNCEKELGGINGDVAGYILVISELVGILTLGII